MKGYDPLALGGKFFRLGQPLFHNQELNRQRENYVAPVSTKHRSNPLLL